MSVSSSWSRRFSSISLPRVSTDEREELILSRVLPSRSLKNSVVLVKIPIITASQVKSPGERVSQIQVRISSGFGAFAGMTGRRSGNEKEAFEGSPSGCEEICIFLLFARSNFFCFDKGDD